MRPALLYALGRLKTVAAVALALCVGWLFAWGVICAVAP